MKEFNVRVYGILKDPQSRVLLSREVFHEIEMVKFPGGGLVPGEGIVDCLRREWREELNAHVSLWQHFYTTEFYQKSAFDDRQILSVYYFVELESMKLSFEARTESKEREFFWHDVNDELVEILTFPIDKEVGRKLNLANVIS